MDYSLAALKLLIGHLQTLASSLPASSSPTAPLLALGKLHFQRAWLQGLLVPGSEPERKLLDDGSGVIELVLSKDFQEQQWQPGMYVLVLGAYAKVDGAPILKGLLVPGLEPERKLLDDGSGVIELVLSKDFQEQQWQPGAYAKVDGAPILKVHKIVDLSSSPDREAMWNMEVIEAYNLFYATSA